jgi:hypothetical protein
MKWGQPILVLDCCTGAVLEEELYKVETTPF